MKKEENPCYNCPDRKYLCRIGCKRAKDFEEQNKRRRQQIFEARKSDDEMRKYLIAKSRRFGAYKSGKIRKNS